MYVTVMTSIAQNLLLPSSRLTFLSAMYNALKTLGYRPYHMSEACLMTPKGHLAMWNEAISGKYGNSADPKTESSPMCEAYAPSDFAKLLQDYDALTDIPSVLFVPELIAAYPHAHLILTQHPRGVDGWLRSIENSFFRVAGWRIWSWPLMSYDTVFSLPYMTLIRRVLGIWTGLPWPAARDFSAAKPALREFYAKHNDEVRTLARSQRSDLLEFDPSEGWGPVCTFLGKEIPAEPYPHINEGNYVVNLHKMVVISRLKAVFGAGIARVAGGVAVVGLAWWWMRW